MEVVGYASVTDIERVYQVKASYVYKLACLNRWRRYRHPDGRTRYRWSDVDAALGRA